MHQIRKNSIQLHKNKNICGRLYVSKIRMRYRRFKCNVSVKSDFVLIAF